MRVCGIILALFFWASIAQAQAWQRSPTCSGTTITTIGPGDCIY